MNRLHAFLAALAVVCLGRAAVAKPNPARQVQAELLGASVVNYQVLPQASEAYAPLQGGTAVSFPTAPTGSYLVPVPLPSSLNFRWFGQPVSTVYLDANGFVAFGNQPNTTCSYANYGDCYFSSGLPISASSASYEPVDSLYGWFGALVANTGTVTYGTETVNGTQVFTIDYQNVEEGYDATYPFGATISFKIRLHPGGSKLDVVYGSFVGSSGGENYYVAGLQNGDTSAPQYALGLPCSAPNSTTYENCGDGNWPTDTRITYLWADKPDLDWKSGQLASVAAGADAGDPVTLTVNAVVENTGTQDAGPFTDQLVLSTTPTLDGGLSLIDTQPVADGLVVNASQALTFSGGFARPPTGKYYLVLAADTSGQVDEVDETNNVLALPLYMGVDLAGTIDAPDAGDVGQPVPVSVSIFSQGVDVVPGPFEYRIYMSTDDVLDPTDLQVYSGTLNPSDLPYNAVQDITIPSNTPAQDFYWLLSIDPPSSGAPSGAIAEADETNNVAVTSHTTHAQLPDLAVTQVQVLSTASPNPPVSLAFFGEEVLVRTTVSNVGQAAARNFDVALFFSGGLGAANINVYSDEQLGDRSFTLLPPGASVTFDTVVTVPTQNTAVTPPASWTAGDFYVFAVADPWTQLGESAENNNYAKVQVHARTPAPDFAPVELDAPVQAAVGEVMPVYRVIRNVGNRGNDGPGDTACPYRYYLSANPTITTEDIPLSIVTDGQPQAQGSVKLAIGADDRRSELLQLPADLAPGTYYLGVLVNPDGNVDEIDPTNDWIDATGPVQVGAPALEITTAWLPDGVVGVGYSVQLTAAGGASYLWSVDPATLPEGLSLSADGLLSGAPASPGTSTFVVSVTAGGTTAHAALTLVTNQISGPLQVLTQNLPSAVANQSYSQFLVAVGGVRPYRWSVVGGALPNGVSLANDGKVSGVPAVQGGPPATFSVLLTDATGATAGATISMRVVSPGSLLISTGALPGGIVGENYPPAGGNNSIVAVNGTPPATFEITAGSIPPGLSLVAEPDRVQLEGRPTQAGLFPFSVRVTDANGQQDDHDFAISVEPSTLSLSPVDLPSIKPGDPYDADLSGSDARASWSLYSGALPAGITLDASGHLGGTCDPKAVAGNYAFTVQAMDRNGRKGLLAEDITVIQTEKRAIPPKSGCGSTSGGATLLALLPLLGLLLRRRRLGTVAAVALCAAPALAFADYAKTTSSSPYTSIAGGTSLISGHANAVNLNLPFPFRFFGQAYGAVSVGTSGYLAFGATANSAVPSFSGGVPVIAPWGDDLEVQGSGESVTYVVNGVSPDRDVVIQWANVDDYGDLNSTGVATHFNFRVHLHEDGQIDFEYGSQTPGGTQTRAIAGLSDGANNTVVALSCAGNFGQCTQSDWPTDTQVVFIAGTDLAVANLTTPGLAYQNQPANIVATVTNPGGQPVSSTTVRFVLSNDTTLGDADDQPLGDVSVTNLTPGSVKSATYAFDSSGLAPGSYFFYATVDPDDAITEDSETNNTYGPVRLDVAAPAPDLSVSSVAASAHSAAPGDALSVNFTVKNVGQNGSPPVPWTVYLSSNTLISQADLQLASGTSAALDGGASAAQTANVTLPSSLAPGSYYLGVVVNPALALDETNPLNDTGYDTAPVKVATGSLSVNTPVGGQLPSTSIGAVYRYAFTASGGDGHDTWSASSALPPGLSLAADGTLSGRPTAAQPAAYSFTVGVVDGAGNSASGSFSLQVSDATMPLAILTQDLVAAEYAQPFVQTLIAVGGQAPYTWTLVGDGKLPDGIILGSDGTLEGLPRAAGQFSFSVAVKDAAATPHLATALLHLSVSGSSLRMRAATPSLPDGTLDVPYNVVLGVTGGFPPYNWQFPYCPDPAPEKCRPVLRFPLLPTDGPPQEVDLPHGLYFGCDTLGNAYLTSSPPNIPYGQDGGTPCYNPGLPADAATTPREAGIYAIPALVTDTANQQLEVTYTLRIGFGQGLAITTAAAPDALHNVGYSFKLQADSPASTTPIHWTLACGERDNQGNPLSPCPEALPPGLNLGDDGTLTGTPTDGTGKTYTFLVRASDEEGRADVRALAITSREATPLPKSSGCGASGGGVELLVLLAPLGLLLRRRRGAVLAALAALALVAGCGKKANTRCTGVTCSSGEICDPGDGLCKCGGEGGLLCADGQICDPTSKACLDAASPCAGVSCTGNTTCDPADGACKCGGPGGTVCGQSQVCQPATRTCTGVSACAGVVCSGGTACDPADGQCKCSGQLCAAGQICGVGADGGGACRTSTCAGVHCTGGTTCDEASGACLCAGTFCGGGQTCACPSGDGGCDASARSCVDSSLCADVTCSGGASCDPADGTCKCGGPGGPVCGANQACDVTVGACIGGDRCRNVSCDVPGTSCDPEDGQCKCGGEGGQVCTSTETCYALANGYACRTACDPLLQDCAPPQGCYVDQSSQGATGYCATPGSGGDGATCYAANDCQQGFHCLPLSGTSFPGTCHRYCDVTQGSTNCPGTQNCYVVGPPYYNAPSDGGSPQVGECH